MKASALDVLSKKEMRRLHNLGNGIAKDLSCNLNNNYLPCFTCRQSAIRGMVRYLRIASVNGKKVFK